MAAGTSSSGPAEMSACATPRRQIVDGRSVVHHAARRVAAPGARGPGSPGSAAKDLLAPGGCARAARPAPRTGFG
jgi:hypothetical protein